MNYKTNIKTLMLATCMTLAGFQSVGAADLDRYSGVCQLGNAKFAITLNQIQGALYGSAKVFFSDSYTNVRVRVNGQKFNVGRGSPNKSTSVAIRASVLGDGNVVRVRATGRGSAFGSCTMKLKGQSNLGLG